MKLKKLEKMPLHRETLRSLNSEDLRRAAGEGPSNIYTGCTSCFCTRRSVCLPCG